MINKNLITQNAKQIIIHNDLAQAQYDFKLNDQKILHLLIGEIRKKINQPKLEKVQIYNKTSYDVFYIIKAQELSWINQPLKRYEVLKNSTNNLLKAIIVIQNKNGITKYPLFSIINYKKKEGYIKFMFNPALHDIIFNYVKNYIKFPRETYFSFNCKYATRLYINLIRPLTYIGKKIITINELRFTLNLQTKYIKYGIFKAKVITSAITDINKNNAFGYEQKLKIKEIKAGRKVISIIFYLEANKEIPSSNTSKV